MATIRKLFTSLSSNNAHSSTAGPSLSTQHQKHPERPAVKGAPVELTMDDLLAQHMAMRSMRMFQAEEEEAKTRIQSDTPSPAPATITTFRAPRRPTITTTPSARDIARLTVAVQALADQTPHLHPWANMPLEHDPLAEMTRTDRSVRTTALANISAIIKGTHTDSNAAALKMEKVRDSCRKAGVPFGELLEEEVDDLKMTPLVLEVIRCDFQNAPELLLFLLEHSSSRNLRWSVRRGCMLRNDNSNLYDTLRHLIPPASTNEWDPPAFEYEISVQHQDPDFSPFASPPSSLPNEFRVLISIPNFPAALLADALALAKRRGVPVEKRGDDGLLRPEAGLVVEWIACGRCWTLEIGSNRLTLSLIDGDPVSLDARMTVIREERPTALRKLNIPPMPGISHAIPRPGNSLTFTVEPPTPSHADRPPAITNAPAFHSEPHSAVALRPYNNAASNPPPRPPRPPRALVFPSTTLYPVHSRAAHSKTTLAPCFPPYAPVTSFIKSVLSSKELLVELVVRLAAPDLGRTEAGRRASVGGRSFFSGGSDKGLSRKGSEFGDVFEEDSPPPQPRSQSSLSPIAPEPVRSSSYPL